MSGLLAALRLVTEEAGDQSFDIAIGSAQTVGQAGTPSSVEPSHLPDATKTVVHGDLRIDNREELCRRLGQSCSTPVSDAELVAACFREWGTATFELLEGDFAFVLWDHETQQLFCVRDPLGMRSLFYVHDSVQLLVAAEIKPLFCSAASLTRKLSETSVGAYLAGQQSAPDATFYAGIRRLPAGHWLAATCDGKVQLVRYWDPTKISLVRHRSMDDYADDFRQRFFDSVRGRLHGASRIGLEVSGGFDSSAVVAVTQHWNEKLSLGLHTWAITNVARQPAANERRYMDVVLARFPMEERTTFAEDFWGFRAESDPVTQRDEPHLAHYFARYVHELEVARQLGIEVILSGSGGDEIGGSSMYLIDSLFNGRILGFWPELKARAAGKQQSARALVKNLVRVLASWPLRMVVGRPVRLPPWLHPPFAQKVKGQLRQTSATRSCWSPARDHLYRGLEFCWNEPQFSQSHQTARRFGVEVRHPFLDRRLFEWALSVPLFRMGENGCVKAPLRRAMADMLPPAIVNRSDKGRYGHYFDLGLREKERPRILEMLKDPISADMGFVVPQRLRSAYDDYCRGEAINRGQLWNWITLEQWLRQLNL